MEIGQVDKMITKAKRDGDGQRVTALKDKKKAKIGLGKTAALKDLALMIHDEGAWSENFCHFGAKREKGIAVIDKAEWLTRGQLEQMHGRPETIMFLAKNKYEKVRM